ALFEAPLTVLCCPEVAAQLHSPADLLQHTLLRSYRADEWPLWFQAAGLPAHAPLTRSIVFDTSLAMLEAARQGVGVALAPAAMFARQLASESIRRPFATEVSTGSYWLTRLQSRGETSAMLAFRGWLLEMAAVEARGR
ncbi:TPA: LysR family transcriptional regulator AmpR, partial [Pseudomonas aeruginosa]